MKTPSHLPALPHSSQQTPVSEAPLPIRVSDFPVQWEQHLLLQSVYWCFIPQSPNPHPQANLQEADLYYISPVCLVALFFLWSQRGNTWVLNSKNLYSSMPAFGRTKFVNPSAFFFFLI